MKKVTREQWQKWEGIESAFQYSTLAILLGSVIILNGLSKGEAKAVIWYWAAGMFALASVTFIIGIISGRVRRQYFAQESERLHIR